MTKDEIMELAQGTAGWHWMDEAHIQRFASALIAAEREACAELCEATYEGAFEGVRPCFDTPQECAAAIRARGEK